MLLLNEIKYVIRQPSLIVTCLLALLFITIIGSAATSQTDLLQSLSLVQMLVLPFLVSIVAANIFLRDPNSNMSELIDCTPQSKGSKLLWRMTSHLIVTTTPFFIGFLIIAVMVASASESYAVQDLLFSFFVLVVPNVFFVSALVIYVARYTANNFSIYVFSALFGGGYMLLGSMLGFPFLAGSAVVNESFYSLMLWLDPLGFTPLLHNQNVEQTVFSHELLLNRLLSPLFSFIIIMLSAKIPQKNRVKTKKANNKDIVSRNSLLLKNRFTEMVRIAVTSSLKSKATLVLILLWAGITFNEVISGLYSLRQTGSYALNSLDAINFVANDLLLVYGGICIAMWSWLVCWNEKKQGFSEIIATTPVSNAFRLLTQCSALFILIFILAFIAAVSSLIVELIVKTDIVLAHYVIQFALSSLPLVLLSIGFVCIHNIVSSPAKAGMIISAILIVKFTPIMSSMGMTHLLWNFAGSPLQETNHFWGMDGSISAFLPFLLFWLLVNLTLYLFAEVRSHRGTGLVAVISRKKAILPYSLALVCVFSVVLINNQLIKEKPLTYIAQQDNWRISYEQKYGIWQGKYQPKLIHVESRVNLFPIKGTATADLKYTLFNDGQVPVYEVLLGRYGNYTNWNIQQSSSFEVIEDFKLQQKIIRFSQPIQPNEKIVLNLDVSYAQPLLWPANSSVVVKEKFTNILTEKFLPQIGYQSSFESDDKQIRVQNGLNAEMSQRQDRPRVTFSTVISTQKGYIVATQGNLTSQWLENGRVYSKYESLDATPFQFVWATVPDESYHHFPSVSSIELYAPTNQARSQDIIDVVNDVLTSLPTSLGVQSTKKLKILAAPEVANSSYVAPGMLVMDFDRVLRNISYSNENLDLLYKKVVEPIVENALLNSEVNNDRHLAELIKGFMLLEMYEQKLGVKSRSRLLEVSAKEYKLLVISNTQRPIAYFDENDPHKTSLRALEILALLQDLMGKAALKSALADYISNPAKLGQRHFLERLKQGLAPEKSKQVERMFGGNTRHLQ
ncbi:hypothetical protein [uncultured Paraglaciecola sp.]|uniref:ABC transporter permease n=1 Tax=uncultured Paraglaciecola sp. TaxID=1765024 RepID=UPI002628E87A|nr:hypothetical protein [uncultured Paraglaciecola sp.]